MSQYPSPYTPPQISYASVAVPPGPAQGALARKIATLLYVLGGIGIAMGLCMGSVVWLASSEQLQVFIDQLSRNHQIPDIGMSPERYVRMSYTVGGALAFIAGCILLVLGYFVRRANKGAIITAMIVCGLGTLVVIVNIGAAATMALGGNSMGLATGCCALVPLSMFGLAVLWLVQLLRALPSLQANWRQYQSQFHQSQQQQAFYNANQYGGVAGNPGYGGNPPSGYPGQIPSAPTGSQGYAMPPQMPASPAPSDQAPPSTERGEPK